MEELVVQYVQPVIVVVCYCICYVINKTTGDAASRYVPLIAAVIGVSASVLVNVGSGISFDSVVPLIASGLVSGLAATGAWELYKTTAKGE